MLHYPRLFLNDLFSTLQTILQLQIISSQNIENKYLQHQPNSAIPFIGYWGNPVLPYIVLHDPMDNENVHIQAIITNTSTSLTKHQPLAILFTSNASEKAHLYIKSLFPNTAILASKLASNAALDILLPYILEKLAPQLCIHGVFLDIYGTGTLITGPSGIGKSYLALQLIQRGHRLVADDAPHFYRSHTQEIVGFCPENIQDLLEIRGLQICNIRQTYGAYAVKSKHTLELVIELYNPDNNEMLLNRGNLNVNVRTINILDYLIPILRVPMINVAETSTLIEHAVRNYKFCSLQNNYFKLNQKNEDIYATADS